jgi:hypothetical protein
MGVSMPSFGTLKPYLKGSVNYPNYTIHLLPYIEIIPELNSKPIQRSRLEMAVTSFIDT